MLQSRLPRLLALGTFALGLFTTANADDDAQAYLVADFDGHGIATNSYMFVNNWEDEYEYTTVQNPVDENSGENIAVIDDGSGSNNVLGFYGLSGEAGYSLGIRVPDLEGCQVMSYKYKGATHAIKFAMDGNPTEDDNHYHLEEDSEDWTTVVFRTSSMRQVGSQYWGKPAVLKLEQVVDVLWQYQPQDDNFGYYSGYDYLYIDDVKCVTPTVYTVNFYHGEELLYSGEFLEGEIPKFPNGWQFSNEYYNYTINGWTPALAPVTANADYVADLDSSERTYEITFRDAYDYGGQTLYLTYGAIPEYTGDTPVKGASEGYTYTFKGWGKKVCEDVEETYCEYYDKEADECLSEYTWTHEVCTYEPTEILPVTENFDYYPMFDSTLRQYTVSFVDYDGTLIASGLYDYGTAPDAITIPPDPTREGGYAFIGWKPDVRDVRGDATYIANYMASSGKFTVTFMNGSQVLQTGEYNEGEVPVYTGEIPTREPSVSREYAFSHWGDVDYYNDWEWTYDPEYAYYDKGYDGIVEVYKNTIYKPVWAETCRKYMVVFKDEDGTKLDSTGVCYGERAPDYSGTTKATMSDDYELAGWILEGDPVPEFDWKFEDWKPIIERTVYVAVYKYKVKFVNDDLSDLYYDYFMPGAVPGLPSYVTPFKAPTVDTYYEFVGWDKEFAPATEPTTYTAIYTPVPVPPSPVLQIADGETFVIDDFEDGDETSSLGTDWFVYNDNDACWYYSGNTCVRYYQSTISKQVTDEGAPSNVLRLTYHRDGGGWVGFGLPLDPGGTLDLSNCSAIQYDYKGGAHTFRVESPYGVDDQHFSKRIYYSEEWSTATFYWSEFNNYYNDLSVDVVRKRATQFIWALGGDGESIEIDNVKCLNKPSYVVRFYDEDGTTLLDSAVFAEGEMPVYRGSKDVDYIAWGMGDERTEYEVEWTPMLAPASENVDYTLNYASSNRLYTVQFYNGDEWYGDTYEYGATPEFTGPTPTMEPDESCEEYAFRWRSYDPDTGDDVYGVFQVTGDRYYFADFNCVKRVTFTVKYLDYNGDVLVSTEVPYGEHVDYWDFFDMNPHRNSTAKYEYYFTGWTPDPYDMYDVTEPATYTATYDSTIRSYPVRFVDYDGSVIEVDWDESREYDYGTLFSSIETPEDPSRDTEDGVEYTFAGWIPALDDQDSVTGPVTFMASYTSSGNMYTVAFMNGTEVLQIGSFAQGVLPVYEGEVPEKYSGESVPYTYTFTGWDKDIVPVSGDVVYNAVFTATLKTFEVVFLNDDGTELARGTYNYGETITDAPTEADVVAGKTGEYEYNPSWCSAHYENVYDGKTDEWVEKLERDGCYGLLTVFGNGLYMANVEYQVLFKDNNGSVLNSDWYVYGESLEYDADWVWQHYRDDVTKPSTVQYDYVWEGGWDKEIAPVTGSEVYTVAFEEYLRKYNVTFIDEDGTVLKEAVAYDYGTSGESVELPAETPTKEPTVGEVFSFAGWDVADVTGNVTYVAQYNSSARIYTISFVDEDDSPIGSNELAYGTDASEVDEGIVPPTKANRRFVGWIPEITDVVGEVTYVAQYVDNAQFVVTWRNADGTLLYQKAYAEGEPPVYGGVEPTMEPSAEFEFEFTGWSPSMDGVTVSDNMEFVATYDEITREYRVVFVNEDGTVLLDQDYPYGTLADDIGLPSETPTKTSTETYSYIFIGWTPDIEDVTGEATYTARFAARPITSSSSSSVVSSSSAEESSSSEASSSSEEESSSSEETAESSSSETVVSSSSEEPEISSSSAEESSSSVQMFTVTYGCENLPYGIDCPVASVNPVTVEYGTLVSTLIPAGTPTIEPTQEYTFAFDGWYRYVSSTYAAPLTNGEIVKGDIKLVAVFDYARNQYKVTFVDWDGSEIASNDYDYGTSAAAITPADPTRESDAQYTYTFAGWSPSVARVTGEATYTATYTPVTRTYTVSYGCMYLPSNNIDCPVASVNPVTVEYGTLVSSLIPAGTPTIEPTQEYTFEFIGWQRYVSNTYAAPLTEGETVKGDIKLVAAFDYATNQYKVTFVDWNGSEIFSDYFEYGLDLSDYLPEDPTRENDERNSYTFAGWSPSIGDVMGEATYTATYTATALASSSSGTVEPSSSSETPVVSSSSEEPVVSSSSETVVASSSSEAVKPSSSSVKPSSSSAKPESSAGEEDKSSSSRGRDRSSSSVDEDVSSSSEAKDEDKSSSSGKTDALFPTVAGLNMVFSHNELTVTVSKASEVKVQVFDMQGHLQEHYLGYSAGDHVVSLRHLNKGVYIVRVASGSAVKTLRIMIK